jgi:hypothetical protein
MNNLLLDAFTAMLVLIELANLLINLRRLSYATTSPTNAPEEQRYRDPEHS